MEMEKKLIDHLEKTYKYREDVYDQIKNETDNNAILIIEKTGGLKEKQKDLRKEYAALNEFAKVSNSFDDFVSMSRKWASGLPTTAELRAKLKGIKINGGLIRRAVRDTNKLKQKAKKEFIDLFVSLWEEKQNDS